MYVLVGDGGQLVGVVSDYFSFRQVDINSSTAWVPGIELGSSGLAGSTFTTEPSRHPHLISLQRWEGFERAPNGAQTGLTLTQI